MTSEAMSRQSVAGAPAVGDEGLRLVQWVALILLEYNVRSSILAAQIEKLAAHMGVLLRAVASYRSVALHLVDGRCISVQAPEYRINVAVSAGAMRLIDQVCAGNVDPSEAIEQIKLIANTPPCHGRWLLALIFGLAASALACILHADFAAVAVSGVSSALGLLARKELAKRHWPLFSLPFVAAAIGGSMGGLAIRLGWTHTPGLCLVVPALMLVPGPHLINGLYDILENHIQPGVCRLVLATAILFAAALGTFAGGWLVMGVRSVSGATSDALQLTLALDVVLAGIAACGFGAFYNAPWRVLWISIVCGMIGHGIRFICLAEGAGLAGSTFVACAVIGLLASIAVFRLRLPFSSVAFASAVPMMPGTLMYRSIAGAAQLSVAGTSAEPTLATATFVLMLQAFWVIGAMATGLLAGALVASFMDSSFKLIRQRLSRP